MRCAFVLLATIPINPHPIFSTLPRLRYPTASILCSREIALKALGKLGLRAPSDGRSGDEHQIVLQFDGLKDKPHASGTLLSDWLHAVTSGFIGFEAIHSKPSKLTKLIVANFACCFSKVQQAHVLRLLRIQTNRACLPAF